MSDKGNLAESCIHEGFRRLFNKLADLYLDLPAAYDLAKRWVDTALEFGLIKDELASECPKYISNEKRKIGLEEEAEEDVKNLEKKKKISGLDPGVTLRRSQRRKFNNK